MFKEDRKDIPKLSTFAISPRAMINPQWLYLPCLEQNVHGLKDILAIEVRLFSFLTFKLPGISNGPDLF